MSNLANYDELWKLQFSRAGRLMDLSELVLGGSDPSDDESLGRVAVHEAGHAMVSLVDGVDFHHVEVFDDFKGGACDTRGLAWLYTRVEFEANLASDVGGAIAEETVFDDVGWDGFETDFRVALARVHIVDNPGAVRYDDERLAPIQRAVARVRKMLRRRKPALTKLAEELLRARSLTRIECVRIVNEAGSRVRVRPLFSPVIPLDELHRCDRARESVTSLRADECSRALALSEARQREATEKEVEGPQEVDVNKPVKETTTTVANAKAKAV